MSKLKEDKISGGLSSGMTLNDIAKKHNVSVDVLVAEFKKGIGVEMEHTTDREIAKEIALDHLFEDPKYYTNLTNMEKNANESLIGELDMMVEESSNFKHFVKTFQNEFSLVEMDRDVVEWLEGVYANKTNKSVNENEKSPEEIVQKLKEMALGDLERIEDYAEMIADRMQQGQDLSSWMYSQITLAVDQLNSVHDAMDGKDGVKESVNEGKFEPNFAKKIEALIKKELGVSELEAIGPRTGRVMNRQDYYFHIPNHTHGIVVSKKWFGPSFPDEYYVALTNRLGQSQQETELNHIKDENTVLKTVSAIAKKYKKQLTYAGMKESTEASDIVKDLDKVRTDLIKKVDVLIAKKKKLYSDVDITTPMSADEKQLDKDIQNIFSQIQQIIQQKRKIVKESVNEGKYYVTYNKGRGQGKDLEKEFDPKTFKPTNKPKVFNSYNDAKKYAEKMEKMFRNSIGGGTAYWVSDEKMNPIKEYVRESTPGEQIQNLNNRIAKLKQDMANAKSPSAKNAIQTKMKNALQKLSDKKKNLGIKKESVNEVGVNDWHFKEIKKLWDKAGSFTKKKIASLITKNPNSTWSKIEDILRGADYDDVTYYTDKLQLEYVNEAPTPKIKNTISKKEWSKIAKYNKHIGMDGTHYIMKYDDKIGTYLQAVKLVDEVKESDCGCGCGGVTEGGCGTAKLESKDGLERVAQGLPQTEEEPLNEWRAEEVLQQMGGKRFIAMTGAKNFVKNDPKKQITFKIGGGAKGGINYVRITLTSMDVYTMEFIKAKGTDLKVVAIEKGVYNDQLQQMFTKHTGMHTRL